MTRLPLLVAALLSAAGAIAPAAAQKTPPTSTQQGSETPAPPAGAKVLHPVAQPAAPTSASAPASAPTSAPAPAPAPQVVQPAPAAVTPQAARPAGAAAGAFTAGLAMPVYAGGTSGAPLEYAEQLTHHLDSTIVSLVDVFRNTAGQPVVGATSPGTLSQRERARWSRCRDLYWDLTTYGAAVHSLEPALPPNPNLRLAVAQLDTALSQNTAVAECDNVASMISAPERWSPWGDQYETSARHFYHDFYSQIHEVHERDRALVFAINAVLGPGRRLAMPAALPSNPPYAGATPN
jgi:hypothetical protein